MGWFYLSWIIVSAVYVSCQELTTSLPEGNDACTRNEVNFTCTIRGSPNLTVLILSWSSDEYIGRGAGVALQFTSEAMSGKSVASMINENVTAILTNNANVSGVPVLVSELRIVGARQDSTIRCASSTNTNSMPSSTRFSVPVFPDSPQNATARHLSAEGCELLVTWDPPANEDQSMIDHYIIYFPSRDQSSLITESTSHVVDVMDCRNGIIRIKVAAVNAFGCEGHNSSQIEPNLLDMPTIPARRLDRRTTGIVGGFLGGAVLLAVVVAVVVTLVVKIKVVKQKQKNEQLLVEIGCVKVFDGLKWGIHPSELVQESMLESLGKISATNVQKGLITFINMKLTSAASILFVLRRLKRMGLSVMSVFDRELQSARSSVTMDRLIEEANEGQRGELTRELKALLEELTEKLCEANPSRVKELLQNLFQELRNVKEERDEIQDVIDKLEEMKMKAGTSSETAKDHLHKVIEMLKDPKFMKELTDITQPLYNSEPSSQLLDGHMMHVVQPKKGSKRKLLEESIEMEPPRGRSKKQ